MSETVFEQQANFMLSKGQSVNFPNGDQTSLCADQMAENVTQTFDAWNAAVLGITSDDFDPVVSVAAVGVKVVETMRACIEVLFSLGIDAQAAWDEVHQSHMTNASPDFEKVVSRSWNVEEAA